MWYLIVSFPDLCPISYLERKSIKDASPFIELFENVKTNAVLETKTTKSNTTDLNPFYCTELMECLGKFLPIFPLWSRIMLRYLISKEYKRDTNSAVELWIKFLKVDLKIRKLRPASFVIRLKRAVDSRLLEQMFPGQTTIKRKRKKRKKKNEDCNRPGFRNS